MTKPKFKKIIIPVETKYKWKAVDDDGYISLYSHKPIIKRGYWYLAITDCNRYSTQIGIGPIPKDFTKTLERI